MGLPDRALPLAGIKRRAPRPAETPAMKRVVADDGKLSVALDDVARMLRALIIPTEELLESEAEVRPRLESSSWVALDGAVDI